MPEEDATHCCMNCERLAGELEDMKSLVRKMVPFLQAHERAWHGIGVGIAVDEKAVVILTRPEVKKLLTEGE